MVVNDTSEPDITDVATGRKAAMQATSCFKKAQSQALAEFLALWRRRTAAAGRALRRRSGLPGPSLFGDSRRTGGRRAPYDIIVVYYDIRYDIKHVIDNQ